MRVVTESNVYVIGSDEGPYKIGVAGDLRGRLAGLQTGSHAKVSVLFSVQVPAVDALRIERRAHKALEGDRLSGEWFQTTLDAAVSSIKEATLYAASNPRAAPRGTKPRRDGSDIIKVPGLEVSTKVTKEEYIAAKREPPVKQGDDLERVVQIVHRMAIAGATPPKALSRLAYAIITDRLVKLKEA
jgi:hypothetical protein